MKTFALLVLSFGVAGFGLKSFIADEPFTVHAEDAPNPTVEELTAQVAAKDQEIAALKHQLTESGRDVSLYRQNFNACVDKIQGDQQKPALNPAQQRMMQRGPKPAEAKPEVEPSK